jgi:N-acetylmuramoyl-L-alanine amidase
MSDKDWLVPSQQRRLTPNRYHSGYKPGNIMELEAVVYHYTASRRLEGTLNWLCDPKAEVSAHFVVDRDGKIFQLAPLSERTWHAGGKTSKLFNKPFVNARTIGIEIMNVGPLALVGDRLMQADRKVPFDGPAISAGGPTTIYKHNLWDAYAPAQMNALVGLTEELVKIWPMLGLEADKRLIGHEDVDPSRKIDPGPAFPWKVIRDAARKATGPSLPTPAAP